MDFLWAIVVAFACILLGAILGINGGIQSIEKDCNAMNKFRNGDAIYQCEKVKK